MKIEYEATFPNIDKDETRKKLKKASMVLVQTEFLQKRCTFNLPKGHEINGGWLRVRDEGNKITLTIKIVGEDTIENQKEITLEVDNFNEAVELLETIGCEKKSFQETKRELWKLGNVEIMIDEWPYLEPFVEIEGPSEQDVKKISERLGFDYSKALFCSITTLYSQKYNLSHDYINNQIPEITFNGKNPFEKLGIKEYEK